MQTTTNPFHFRARIDRLWRRANSHAPAYRRLNALDAVVRELFAPNDRARRNHQMYLVTDPFDVARHFLRDLHDRPHLCSPPPQRGGRCRRQRGVPLSSPRERNSRKTMTPGNANLLSCSRSFFFLPEDRSLRLRRVPRRISPIPRIPR